MTTESTACSMPKLKVYRMWDDCFRPKTECLPKVLIFQHSALKPKPKFGRPLIALAGVLCPCHCCLFHCTEYCKNKGPVQCIMQLWLSSHFIIIVSLL